LLETGQTDEARTRLDRLLAFPGARENGEIYWLLLYDRGRIAEDEGSLDDALDYYRRAADIVERQRATIRTEAGKIGFIGEKQAIYYRIVDLALRLERPLLAFEYIERAKSRALVDLLAEREQQAPLAARDARSQRLLDAYRSAEEIVGRQRPLDPASNAGDDRRVAAAQQGDLLRAAAPELASLVTVSALTAEELRRHIRPDEALIEYFGFGDALYGLALDDRDAVVRRLDAGRIEDRIREYRAGIARLAPQAGVLARQLHEQLVKPFASIIGNRNLVIVPHGPLHYLPFSALHDGRSWLVGSRSLRMLPSVSAQSFIRPQREASLGRMVLFGNPDIGNPALDLPDAESEVRSIAALEADSRTYTRRAASETSFRKEAPTARYLHLASHGEFRADKPLESRLLLAPDTENDGVLTVREIYDMRLDADLVTLSACQTGLGSVRSGDDLVGLTRGFFYAGSRNVVATLWEVSDEATAMLMKEFYRLIKAGRPKQEALRQSQLLLQRVSPHPFYWAAFQLTGSGI
jgi:hypothetical protein